MTIKRRLFVSNILMIVIPIILTISTMLVVYGLLNIMFQGSLHDTFQGMQVERELRFAEPEGSMRAQMMLVSVFCFVGLIAVIYLTNRFLIRFVFRNIERPLDVLTQGVHQIKNGNLDHRIEYTTPDEFKPICEDFNEMASRLKNSVDEAVKNEQSRKELIAGISHDLRSPLTSIKAYVEGLIDGVAVTQETQQEYLETIRDKTDDISKMVSQLFLFSKMDTGSYPVNPEMLDIATEISDFVNATKEDYQSKGLSVSYGDLPKATKIFADPTQLRSVFTNILENSAKYKDKDAATVFFHYEVANGIVVISIEDNGAGVPPDTLSKLFDVFYRGDVSRNNPQQGSGLGLAIASKMIERMEGAIYAENRAEGGLRVVIKIPVFKEAEG